MCQTSIQTQQRNTEDKITSETLIIRDETGSQEAGDTLGDTMASFTSVRHARDSALACCSPLGLDNEVPTLSRKSMYPALVGSRWRAIESSHDNPDIPQLRMPWNASLATKIGRSQNPWKDVFWVSALGYLLHPLCCECKCKVLSEVILTEWAAKRIARMPVLKSEWWNSFQTPPTFGLFYCVRKNKSVTCNWKHSQDASPYICIKYRIFYIYIYKSHIYEFQNVFSYKSTKIHP